VFGNPSQGRRRRDHCERTEQGAVRRECELSPATPRRTIEPRSAASPLRSHSFKRRQSSSARGSPASWLPGRVSSPREARDLRPPRDRSRRAALRRQCVADRTGAVGDCSLQSTCHRGVPADAPARLLAGASAAGRQRPLSIGPLRARSSAKLRRNARRSGRECTHVVTGDSRMKRGASRTACSPA
jgi:hypothetical protein